MMVSDRVVVTGLGPVTPIGVGAADFHAAQLSGVSGVRRISLFDASRLDVDIAGEVDLPPELAPTPRQLRAEDRCTHLALAAARLAVQDSGLDLTGEDPDRVGVALGSAIGGIDTWEENVRINVERGPGHIRARFIPMAMVNSAAARLSIEFGARGPSLAPVAACASGAEALVAGARMIESGEADVVIAGGSEAPVVETIVGGFTQMRALSTRTEVPERASRPFAAGRDGFVIAEGAAVLILESAAHAAARQARVYAEFAGSGRASDAFHVTMPHKEGAGARRAVEAALRSAGLAPDDVAYVNAHGTGTPFNDLAETMALRAALGTAAERVAVSATKSMTGHGLGAAGAIEAVATVQAIVNGVVPPTVNLEEPDPELGLDLVPLKPRDMEVRVALSNSFAFGGHNVVLAFRAW